MNPTLLDELTLFLDRIDLDVILAGVPENELEQAKNTVNTFKGEALVALSLIESTLKFEDSILEVGAGLCLLSLFLKSKGYSITALEPLAGGFGFFTQLKQNILRHKAEINLTVIDKPVQLISPDDGTYSLIFSNNVMEHIMELPEAMHAMKSVLRENGKMIHGCPNYLVPYEPHFGLPVLAIVPNLTKSIWRQRIAAQLDVWESLNFISYFRVRKLASEVDCAVYFAPELTYKAFMRLNGDEEFRARHRTTLVGKCLRMLEVTGTLSLTRYLPAWASTPMIFTLSHKSNH